MFPSFIRHSPILYILPLLFIGCISIIKLPDRTFKDKYDNQCSDLISTSKLKFIEMDHSLLCKMEPKSVYIFGPWCAPCVSKLMEKGRSMSNSMYIVSTTYDIKEMQKLFLGSLDTIYIINNSIYGGDERSKIFNFIYDLTGKYDSLYAVPKILNKESILCFE